jgi:mono/diheme cytochrome c family protein
MIRQAPRHLLWGWLLGVATCAVASAVMGGLILSGIIFDTSATQAHSKIFAWSVHQTMINSVARRASPVAPRLAPTRDTLLAGARQYQADCVACHGGPGIARAPFASAMLPTPPYLVDATRRWSHGELYKLVHDGVKMTGMPAWGEVKSDRQVAQIVALIEAMPKMTPEQFHQLFRQARGDAWSPRSARDTP